jgi:hypothetical protein
LGTLLGVVPPATRLFSWSAGLLAVGAAEEPAAKELRKPPHKRGYLHRHVSPACRAEVQRRGLGESRVAIGQEALFSLHGGRGGVWGVGDGADDAAVLRGAFERMAERYANDALRIRVCYGAEDGMIPAKGRMWLKGTLEELGFLKEAGAWVEVEGAGHDDALFLQDVVAGILARVRC